MTVADIMSPVVLLTGPTRGLGSAIVDALVEHPSRPELVLVGRDPVSLRRVGDRARHAGACVHTVEMNLSDLTSVTRACAEVTTAVAQGRLRPITAYIANAGLQLADRRQVSAQGHELTFSVNVLAQHAILHGLRPALASDAHVVMLGSSTHRGRMASYGLTPSPRWADRS